MLKKIIYSHLNVPGSYINPNHPNHYFYITSKVWVIKNRTDILLDAAKTNASRAKLLQFRWSIIHFQFHSFSKSVSDIYTLAKFSTTINQKVFQDIKIFFEDVHLDEKTNDFTCLTIKFHNPDHTKRCFSFLKWMNSCDLWKRKFKNLHNVQCPFSLH